MSDWFLIGETDFQLDLAISSVQFVSSGVSTLTIDIDFHADESRFEVVCDAPESMLYQPAFYALGVIQKKNDDECFEASISSSLDDNAPESAIYLMEHHELIATCFAVAGNELRVHRIFVLKGASTEVSYRFQLLIPAFDAD